MSSFTGFDPEEINQLAKKVEEYAKETGTVITDNLEKGIISPISKCWYTPEGRKYWEGFRDVVSATGKEIAKSYNSFIDVIGSAEKNWAENTQATVNIVKGTIDNVNMNLNIEEIKEKDGNRMGINEQEATVVAGNISNVQSNIKEGLSNIAKKLDANSAFIGQNQGEAVQSLFNRLADSVSEIFKFLTEDGAMTTSSGESQSVRTAIKNAVSKYGDSGKNIANSLSDIK